MKPRCQKRVCSKAIEFTVAWSSINGIGSKRCQSVPAIKCNFLSMRFVMMDIDAVPIRIGRINVKSWNDFQSSHTRLPFAPVLPNTRYFRHCNEIARWPTHGASLLRERTRKCRLIMYD